MSETAQRLLEMKNTIAEKKTKMNKLEGQLQGLMEQIKVRFNVIDIESAKVELQAMDVKLKKQTKKIDTMIRDLEDKYDL